MSDGIVMEVDVVAEVVARLREIADKPIAADMYGRKLITNELLREAANLLAALGPQDPKDERKAFETWHRSEYGDVGASNLPMYSPADMARVAWAAWQASARRTLRIGSPIEAEAVAWSGGAVDVPLLDPK